MENESRSFSCAFVHVESTMLHANIIVTLLHFMGFGFCVGQQNPNIITVLL